MTVQVNDKKYVKPKLDERFLSNIKGKDFVLYAGLLDLSHQLNINSIKVEAIQFPTAENGYEAICKATVISEDGQQFDEIGDANPKNVNRMIKEHILRMAATRAKARALRDFTNIGMTCLEELGNLDDIVGNDASKTKRRPITKKAEIKEFKADEKVTATPEVKKENKVKEMDKTKTSNKEPKSEVKQSDKPQMSQAQKRAIYNLSKRRGIGLDELKQKAVDAFNVNLEFLSTSDASSFIRDLQHAA